MYPFCTLVLSTCHRNYHRAAIAPFIANVTADSYKWILYGDDDTVFNVDNVLRLVSGLNASQPYLLTDCLWFPQGITGACTTPRHCVTRCILPPQGQ